MPYTAILFLFMNDSDVIRIDKWLWAVRLFKTRSQATQACRAGKVKIGEQAVKPSRDIHPGTVITLQSGPIQRTVKVKEPLEKRVGAKLVDQYMEDITPREEYQKLEIARSQAGIQPFRKGRPTKKERREMDRWFGWD